MPTQKRKTVILVGDGMGDRPIALLGGLTPLEYAATPAMDFVASQGELALLKTVPDGYPPGSDVANLSLLGYRPEECYSGRAPLEAASMGVALAANDIAFRCNLVTLGFSGDERVTMVDYSAGHISTPEARELIAALQQLNRPGLAFYPGVSYRHLLVAADGPEHLATEPPHDHSGNEVGPIWDRLRQSALGETVLRAAAILADHPVNRARRERGQYPANAIWLWGQGRAPAMASLQERYGVGGSLISAVDLLKGIGVYAGLKTPLIEGATGYIDTNYQGKVDAALAALAEGDFVLIHVEAPDEAGHQGSQADKLKAIADFDAQVVAPVLAGLQAAGAPFRLVVAMDHYTPLEIRTHDRLPVPVAVYDSAGAFASSGRGYSEKNASASGVFYGSGAEFFDRLMK
ncbi:MAG: cofactor-independent phosphoglycerate mutase [Desulfobulbaceae bacterium]|nr:cofactor-independent phosphoglycerate mutase [Desulfobulbaceae bacterium]